MLHINHFNTTHYLLSFDLHLYARGFYSNPRKPNCLDEGEDNLETEEEWEWQGEKNDQRTETCQ